MTVEPHGADSRIPEPEEETGDRGLAGAGRADQRHRAPARDGERDLGERGSPSARIGEGDLRHLKGRPAGIHPVHAGAVRDEHALRVHGVHAARRAQRIGELATHLGDLPHGDEGGHGQQREQRQDGRVEPARRAERRAHHDDGEPADPRGDLLQRGLQGQVVEEGHAHPEVLSRLGGELLAARAHLPERDDLAQPLDRIHGMRGEIAGDFARARAEPVDARAPEDRREGGPGQEGQQSQGQGPAEARQHEKDADGHEHGHEGGRDRVGEEVLDQLDVMSGHADQIARAPSREIGGGQRVELAEHVEAHVGEQAIGHVMGQPRLEPVQDARERRGEGEGDQQPAERRAVLDRAHDERAQYPHPDQRDHPRHAEHEGDEEPRAVARDHAEEHANQLRPAHPLRAQDRVRRLEERRIR